MPARSSCVIFVIVLLAAGVAQAWDGDFGPLVDDRVLTLTVREKAWGLGGVSVDKIGNVYVADFAETVWKVSPDGAVIPFATGFYGATGNALDAHGHLFQSSFYADSVSEISRTGEVSTYVAEGLAGPVGIAIAPDGTLFVCNCRSNTVSRVSLDREASEWARFDGLIGCPNGIALGPDEKLYVVGFGRPLILEVSATGDVRILVQIPGSWLAHLVLAAGKLYVTSFGTNEIYRVDLSGHFEVLTGTPERGIAGGSLGAARFSNPNGIAASPLGGTLYVSSIDSVTGPVRRGREPSRLVLSRIDLVTLSERLVGLLETRGVEAAGEAYRAYKSDPQHADENTEGAINFLGYWLLLHHRVDDAVAVFELNTESYPESANVWDSLAEGLLRRGDRDRAIELYKKSLQMNPENRNAREQLKLLGVGSDGE